MLVRIAMALLLVTVSLPAIAENGIPYQLACKGEKNKSGRRMQITLEGVDSDRKLAKVYLDNNGGHIGEAEYFHVDEIGPKGQNFRVESTYDGLFAGSGSRKGTLSFLTSNSRGSWKEVTTTFDEDTTQQVEEIRTSKITCDLAQ